MRVGEAEPIKIKVSLPMPEGHHFPYKRSPSMTAYIVLDIQVTDPVRQIRSAPANGV